jgi:hypothetical protein
VVSVSPNAGSGVTQTFSFIFGDTQTAANLSGAAMLFGPSLAYTNSCLAIYDKNQGTIQLEWDGALGSNGKPVASAVVLQNSQCNIGATSVVSSGLTTTITMDVTFKGAFGGLKNIYMYGVDNGGTANTGWVQAGTFTNASGTPTPSFVSVTPNAGSGPSQTFSFVFADNQNAANLTGAVLAFAPSLALQNSCMVMVDRSQGTVQLAWDSLAGSDKKAVGSAAAIQNSQCSIGANSVVSAGLTTTISFDVTFKSGFTGAQNIYAYGVDNGGATSTGWVQAGTWTAY